MPGVSAHGGVEATADPRPGSRGYFRWYWTKGPGRAKWSTWTELYDHIAKHVGPGPKAKRITESWYFATTGRHGGSDANRVAHGKPPRGKVVGPG
jgi:hypothetical protein